MSGDPIIFKVILKKSKS